MTMPAGRLGTRTFRTGRLWTAFSAAMSWPGRAVRARALMGRLVLLEEHELRDIGLTRQDLRDANASLFDTDPSLVLRRRVEERRRRR